MSHPSASSPAPHYLFVCVGTVGDVHPFIRVAQSFQELGHTVKFITNTFHLDLLERSGLAAIGVGTKEEYLRILQDPDIWHPRRGFSALLAHYRDQLQQLDAAIRSIVTTQSTVAISHPITVPGAVIARDSGLISKIVFMHLAPSTMRTCHDPLRVGDVTVPRWVPMSWRKAYWQLVERVWVDPIAVKEVNEARHALHLPPISSTFLTHIESTPDLTVTLFPEWFGPRMPDWPRPLLMGDFQLFDAAASTEFTSELAEFLAAGDQPLVFTPGTGHLHASNFFTCALASVKELGLRAIFLTRDRSQAPPELPDSVLWQRYVPLSGLLPLVKAIVHHGGAGTTAEALRAGTPQLVTPFAWDQFDNGARVQDLGVGLAIPAAKLNQRKLTHAIRSLLDCDKTLVQCKQASALSSKRKDNQELCMAMIASVDAIGKSTPATSA